MTRRRKTSKRWPFSPPRDVRSVIYGAQGEIIYRGPDPEEAKNVWAKMLRAAFPEQFGNGKKKRKRFGSLHR